jgi:hypothetical protein
LGLRLIVGSVEEGGGGADPVAATDEEDELAGAAVASLVRRRAHTQEVRPIILTTEDWRSTREPFILSNYLIQNSEW